MDVKLPKSIVCGEAMVNLAEAGIVRLTIRFDVTLLSVASVPPLPFGFL